MVGIASQAKPLVFAAGTVLLENPAVALKLGEQVTRRRHSLWGFQAKELHSMSRATPKPHHQQPHSLVPPSIGASPASSSSSSSSSARQNSLWSRSQASREHYLAHTAVATAGVAASTYSSGQRRCLGTQKPMDIDDNLRADIDAFATMEPHPCTLQDVLSCLEPCQSAQFIHTEMPIRIAERIRWLESLESWQEIPQLVHVHDIHVRAFQKLRSTQRHPTLDKFTKVVKQIVDDQHEVVRYMAAGMHKLRQLKPELDTTKVDEFLDAFLLNRFGSNVLMSQYLALAKSSHGPTGVIDPHCDPAQVCRDSATAVQDVCEEYTGRRPYIRIETRVSRRVREASAMSAAENKTGEVDGDSDGADGDAIQFAYIPGALKYIICEILKNSCRATVEVCADEQQLEAKPIRIVVCADEHHIGIWMSDEAGGIPFQVGTQVWSYMYSTAKKVDSNVRRGAANELAGFGVGLPISRLYARYLGGSLDLISLPGYGTHAYLFLPRLSSDQIEVVPDRDAHFAYHTLGDYALGVVGHDA
eukprot:CAMPEP_0206477496 /NCGR_PEP_ID=MMETSP0324_2-20121206/35413_1 /ASSEMBLY_ACC=CAM_ASM_000836 /TAXON_ID=2866 /ORGANISM="Crypthecodinium cohnii, Strain Seligo" /LENGTH=529 /DNA_ID=CAMNT_0053953463 /DNA_START=40 /DNA_END=1629 /DNA_ORIENTATION=+